MRHLLFASVLLAGAAAFAQAPAPQNASPQSAPQPKVIRSFDMDALDRSADPCTDFYQFACGGWRKANPIPSDQARWGRFNELEENNRIILRQLLEGVSSPSAQKDANDQKIGDYYASCMDEKAVESKGLKVLQPELDRITKLKSKAELPAYLAHVHVVGPNSFFGVDSEPDAKNATMMIAGVDQAGLGLPDRDYYLKDDAKSVDLRNKYVQHVQKMFELAGYKPEQASAAAKTVLRIETELAKASLDRISRRDPNLVFHKMTVKELSALSPAFDWNKYFASLPTPKINDLNVSVPDFFKGMNQVVTSSSLPDIKTYLTWHILHESAGMLPSAFVNENFAFYGKALTGAQEIRPRWKRCVGFTDAALGEALGKSYVEKTFGPEGKQRTLAMVNALEKALSSDIKDLPWMTETTKKQAQVKLEAIQNKIGYPDKWRDYSKLNIVRGDALGNYLRANEFESRRQLAKIGKPVDKTEWMMSPPTVNAYYNPLENNINFPAGILQPPFFDRNGDDAVNYGGIGVVIGHELTHGFDDEGRQFDAKGNLRDWWTEQDAKAFEERAQCLVEEYNGFSPVADVYLKGKLTLGENTADNGGLRVSMMALRDVGMGDETKNGFTPEQRYFLGYAQVWCENSTPEYSRMMAQVNPHSPGRFRVNGVVSNSADFQKAFQCKAGTAMVSPKPCRVW